jgi:predicted DNA-binding transcriptional regulator AlpA
VAHSIYDDELDEDPSAPWALGADDPERLDRWDSDDCASEADTWLDEQLGRLRPATLHPDEGAEAPTGSPAGLAGLAAWFGQGLGEQSGPETEPGGDVPELSRPPDAGTDEVVLRHPAPARPPRRRRADPDAAADLPVASVPGYVRDRRGTWRYSATGQTVPGARDLTLRSLHRFPVRRRDVLAPVERVRSEAELAWCMAWKGTLATRVSAGGLVTVLRVPIDEWERRADIPFGLWAPELAPTRLLGVADVAHLVGVSPATITAYLSRGRMPPPVTRVGNSPVWSRPVIHQWLAGRPGQGVRPRR